MCEFLDWDNHIGKLAHVTEWVKKSDCVVIEQKYHVQEKNPNKIDSPEFKCRDVKIISNIIRELTYDVVSKDISSATLDTCGISKAFAEITFSKIPKYDWLEMEFDS